VRVRVVEDVEGLIRRGGEFEVGSAALVRDGDGQLIRVLLPEEQDLDAVVRSVCKLSVPVRRVACHRDSFRSR
jgi:hypothetical protein